MAEGALISREDVIRQIRQHLESCRASGIEWLPVAETVPLAAPSCAVPPNPAAAESGRAPDLRAEERQTPELPLDQRRQELSVLAGTVAGCTRCPALAS